MLDTVNNSDGDGTAEMAHQRTLLPSRPLLASISETGRLWGGLGKTATYSAIRAHKVQLVRIGGRSMVPMSEIDRVVADLMHTAPVDGTDRARQLAARSVARRRVRRGGS